MKNFKQACAVALLTVTMAVSASANSGTISCPGATSPPPPPSGQIGAPAESAPEPDGTISSPGTSSSITTTIVLTIISLVR